MPHSKLRRYLKHGTFPQLAVFDAIARLGSFTRAAEELYMAQPTVSIQIKKLTETVGLPLFEQVGKKIHLTEAGTELNAAVQDVFRRLEAVEDRFADLRGLRAGRLRLAVAGAAKYFAPRLLGVFCGRHPGIEVSLHVTNEDGLLARLQANLDDVYILGDRPEGSDLVVKPLLPNEIVVIARRDHALAGRRKIPFARFAEEQLLMREPGSASRRMLVALFERHKLRPRVRMELASNEAVKQAVLGGLGVAALSRYALGLDVRDSEITILDVKGFPLRAQWCVAYPAGRQLSVAARAFEEFMHREAKPLVLEHLAR
ncbi:MAG TPA: LysR substrate-binding domain-containing protein [Burkholderiales bacterium]|nr:LysR substrate-binding domain-containing protein [Burkholderiales bacterium]